LENVNVRPGQLAILTGNHVSMLLVEPVPHGFKLTDADGTAGSLPLPFLADDGGKKPRTKKPAGVSCPSCTVDGRTATTEIKASLEIA
jgi:hypothetical protein